MKNTQKGFIVPLLIAIITILVIGGGYYITTTNKTVKTENTETQTNTYNNSKNTPVVDTQAKAQTTSIKPSITSLSQSSVPLLSEFIINGLNFDPLGAYVGNGWLTSSHVLVKITDNNGQTGILWEGGSQGGNTSSANQITVPGIPKYICKVSEVGVGGCPDNSKMEVKLGQYSLSVTVDGRGISNPVVLNVTQGMQ